MTLINSVTSTTTSVATASAGESASSAFGQQDFMTLMLAQMQNQDPTDPLDPNQFMSQLAQFSTVSGIQELQSAFASLSDTLSAGQALQSASLIGHSVLVEGAGGTLEEGGTLRGMAVLTEEADSVTVTVTDAAGRTVRSFSLGPQAAGQLYFQWDGLANDGTAAPSGTYQVQVQAQQGDTAVAASSGLAARVESVTLGGSSTETILNLTGGGSVRLSQVQEIL